MKLEFKQSYRPNGKYPLLEREKFLKCVNKNDCELHLIGYDWVTEKQILQFHKEYNAKNKINNKSSKEILKSLKELVSQGFVQERVING